MRSIIELSQAIANNEFLIWNDLDPIDGNDYTISWIEKLDDTTVEPILIQYNNGESEAQAFLHEIIYKNNLKIK